MIYAPKSSYNGKKKLRTIYLIDYIKYHNQIYIQKEYK